jgi:type III secretion protein Q
MPRDSKHIAPLHPRLPLLTPSLARLTRVLFTPAAAALAAPAGWRIVPLAQGSAPAPAQPACLQLHSAHGGLRCVIDLAAHPALESAALAAAGHWRAALADALLRPCWTVLTRLGLPALSVAALLTDADATAHHAGVALQLRADDDAPAPTLFITDIDAGLLDALEAALPPQAGLPDWLEALPLGGSAVLAARRATTALLASLRAGDVLLGWRGGMAGSAQLDRVTLRWGAARGRHVGAVAAIAGRAVTLATSPTLCLESHPMDHTEHPVTDVAALELPVTLEIVTLAMPLQQIGALLPGQVLELPLALADTRVRLVACGQTLGHGKLVVVGEQLGFQVTTMVHQDEPDA